MSKVYEGNLVGADIRVGIVVSRFNEFITSKLLSGALDGLQRHGVVENNIEIAWTPGAYEIPLTAKMMTQKGYDVVLCLGTVIRGATPHFEYVSAEVAKGIAQVSLSSGIPVIFGILTTDNIEQAIERAGTKAGNKGFEAAMAGIEMVNLFKNIKG